MCHERECHSCRRCLVAASILIETNSASRCVSLHGCVVRKRSVVASLLIRAIPWRSENKPSSCKTHRPSQALVQRKPCVARIVISTSSTNHPSAVRRRTRVVARLENQSFLSIDYSLNRSNIQRHQVHSKWFISRTMSLSTKRGCVSRQKFFVKSLAHRVEKNISAIRRVMCVNIARTW